VRRARAALIRLRAIFQRRRLDRELASEIESHLAHHIDDNLRAGMTMAEARRVALARLGGVVQVQERYRDARGVPAVERLATDVRYAVRALWRAPVFTTVAIASLAFGIGANAAIFSVVNALFFKPLPGERPDRLVSIARGPGFPGNSYPDYRDVRDRNTVLSSVSALRFSPMNLEVDNHPRRTWGLLVSGNYFEMLGVRAALGRTLAPADDRSPGKEPVVVLSDGYWRAAFGADAGVVGRIVRVNGLPFTVLGVMPATFRGTERLFVPDVWVPISMVGHIESGNDWLERRHTHNVFLVGRLRDGVSSAAAEASLNTIAEQLGREHPQINEGMRFVLIPPGLMATLLRGPAAGFGGALLGVAGLVLLLTCTNLAGLLLARSADRQRDTAVRLALGARRADLIRRSLVESALVSVAGAAGALVLAWWASAALSDWRLPSELPIAIDVTVDSRVFAVGAALAILCTFLVGIVPAIQGSRGDIVPALKDETTRWRGGWHVRDAIVAAQVALSTILLVGALLVVRSLQHATDVDVGFVPDRAITLSLDLGLEGYDRARGQAFQREIVERLSATPGIESVGVASALPLTQDTSTHSVHVEGQPPARGARVPSTLYYQVSPGFLRAFGARLVAGRDLSESDTPDRPPVAIVNEAFASRFLGGQAIGRRFRTGSNTGVWIEVIGVVRDGKYQSLGEDPAPVAFHSMRQWYNPSTVIVARAAGDEDAALGAARRIVRDIDPRLSIFADGPLRGVLALPLLPAKAAAALLGAFGALAIVMVLVGTYGATSYAVTARSREICIRVAVGASAAQVARLVLSRAALVWAAGVFTGLGLAFAGAPMLAPILVGVAPRDPTIATLAAAIVAMVTVAAVWHPSRRAMAINPSGLLRDR
jgi:predicted permease